MDAIVIGGGPGGYSAAIRIAQLGGKAILIEKDKLGGTCANKGCIPTKTLKNCAELLHGIGKAKRFGIEVKDVKVDFEAMMKWKNRVVDTCVKGMENILKSYGIEIIKGTGKIMDKNHVKVNGKTLEAKNIIIATGSVPAELPHIKPDGKYILTSDDILELKQLPKSLLIIGGGVIAVEFATIFQKLGTKVTIVEMLPHIIPAEDTEISEELEKIFKGKGIDVLTNTKVTVVDSKSKTVEVSGKKIPTDLVFLSVGRKSNFDPDELKNAGIEFDKNGIKVDDRMKTKVDNVYAVGDVTGDFIYAYVAFEQGIVAGENVMNLDKKMNYDVIPSCIYTIPEVASVGLTTEDAKKEHKIKEGRFPYIASGKARYSGKTKGLIKVILEDETYKLLGVHIIGSGVAELIAEAALALKIKLNAKDIIETLHIHPTLSEAFVDALRNALGEDFNLPRK
jgi:dihydrolipoamide dehydrogenase